MQLIDGQKVFSATDLVGFLACEHLTALELAAAARLVKRPNRSDPELDVMHQRGLAHEARYLADLEAAGRRVTRIEPDATLFRVRCRTPRQMQLANGLCRLLEMATSCALHRGRGAAQ
jgi:hypothetical protein